MSEAINTYGITVAIQYDPDVERQVKALLAILTPAIENDQIKELEDQRDDGNTYP
jgi:hypothetical protein